MFDKINKHLESVFYLLKTADKKESGITVKSKKDAERKRQIVDIPKNEQTKFRKELDLPTVKKQKLLNLLPTRK